MTTSSTQWLKLETNVSSQQKFWRHIAAAALRLISSSLSLSELDIQRCIVVFDSLAMNQSKSFTMNQIFIVRLACEFY